MKNLLDQGIVRARIQNRSFWRLRYTDGTVVNEWDCDWSLAPYSGRQALRLCCPDGKIAELGSDGGDATGRLFQLKVATLLAGVGRSTTAHIIGIVDREDGWCRYAAWDYSQNHLVQGHDNARNMLFQNIGPLAFEPLGLKL